MSSIEEAFAAKIESLGTPAGSRIFREVIEQEPQLPAISFIRTGTLPVVRLLETSKPALQSASLRVEIIANSSGDAESVASALKAALDGWSGTSLGVEVVRCVCTFQGEASVVDGDQFLKITQQDYELLYR